MNLSIPAKELASAVATVMPIIATRTTLPILSCVRLSSIDGKLAIESTNLEIYLSNKTDHAAAHADPVCVSASLLRSALDRFGPKTVTITGDGKTLELSADKDRVKLLVPNASEWPAMPVHSFDSEWTWEKEVCNDLEWCNSSASDDPGRYALNGILLAATGELVATDGRSLALVKRPERGGSDIILPSAAASAIVALLKSDSRWEANNNWLRITCGGITMLTKLIDANFPRWQQVVPQDGYGKLKFTCNRDDLLSALKGCAYVEKGKVYIEPTDMGASIIARHPDRGEASNWVAGQCDIDTAVEPAVLQRALSGMGDNVEIVADDEFSPLLIKDGNRLGIAMPMRKVATTQNPTTKVTKKKAASHE